MYTFVYRTFIKFILFCRGQALDEAGLELLRLEPIQRAYSKASFNALSGLYLISTFPEKLTDYYAGEFVSMPSRAYTSFLRNDTCLQRRETIGVNALSGLYLIST